MCFYRANVWTSEEGPCLQLHGNTDQGQESIRPLDYALRENARVNLDGGNIPIEERQKGMHHILLV